MKLAVLVHLQRPATADGGDCSFTHSDGYNSSNKLDNLAHLSDLSVCEDDDLRS